MILLIFKYENLDINLKYFYAINKTIKYNQQCLSKFKKCTNDYSENISQILKEGENFLNDYEIIDSDYIALESNDTKNNFSKEENSSQKKSRKNKNNNNNENMDNIFERKNNNNRYFIKY